MTVTLNTEEPFGGRLFAQKSTSPRKGPFIEFCFKLVFLRQCESRGNGRSETSLTFLFEDEAAARCGVERKEEVELFTYFRIFLQPLSYLMAIFRECIQTQWLFSTTPSSRGKGTELSSSSASLKLGTSSSPTAMTSWPSESMTTEISHRNLTFLVSQHNRRRN